MQFLSNQGMMAVTLVLAVLVLGLGGAATPDVAPVAYEEERAYAPYTSMDDWQLMQQRVNERMNEWTDAYGDMGEWDYARMAEWQKVLDEIGFDEEMNFVYAMPEARHVPHDMAVELAVRALELKYDFDRDLLDQYRVRSQFIVTDDGIDYWSIDFFAKEPFGEGSDLTIYLTEINADTGAYQLVYGGEYGYG